MNKRNAIILLVLLLAIGFAAVSTTLFINGTALFGTNEEEFTVIFTKAIVDDVDLSDTAISDDGKTITYETKELAFIDEESILDFTVKNNSTQYDAKININCIGGANEGTYYELEYDLPDYVAAQSETDGYVKARMIRSSVNEIIEELTCTLNVTAMERTEATEVIVDSPFVIFSDEDEDGVLSLGDVVTIGDEVTVGTEQFYVVSNDGTNVKMLSMYNLYVGNECVDDNISTCSVYTTPTGIQDSTMLGYENDQTTRKGATSFSSSSQKGTNYNDYEGSIIEEYVNNYSSYLTTVLGIENIATLMSKEDIEDVVGKTWSGSVVLTTLGAPEWLYSTSYWTNTPINTSAIWTVQTGSAMGYNVYNYGGRFGVRPLVTISAELFKTADNICVPKTTCNAVGDVCWTDQDCSDTKNLGDIVSLGTKQNSIERFYILSIDETNIKMLAKYNLYVGGEYVNNTWTAYTNPTGIQNSTMLGYIDNTPRKGVTAFSSSNNNYSSSIVKSYVDNYSNYLKNTLKINNTSTIITAAELEEIFGIPLVKGTSLLSLEVPAWLYSTNYWTRSASNADNTWLWCISRSATYATITTFAYNYNWYYGVRPVVTISTNLLQ